MADNGDNRDDGHILHLPQPFDFEVTADYDWLRDGAWASAWYSCFRRFAELVLAPINPALFGFSIDGGENADVFDPRGAVVVCNHVAVMDCTYLEFAFPYKRTYFTTLETNFRIPIARHLIRWLGGVPIPRSAEKLGRFNEAMVKAVSRGDIVIFYPEGVLYPYYNGVRRFSQGAFRLAAEAKVPVIPAVVTFRQSRLRRRPSATLTMLSPIEPPDLPLREASRALADECRASMASAVEEINRRTETPSDPAYFLARRAAAKRG